MNNNNQSLADKISEQIKSHKIKMKPKTYFIFGSVLMGMGIAAAILVTVFFFGIIFHRMRVQAPLGYLGPGLGGLVPFIQNFPWLPLIIALIGIVGGLYLIRKFKIGYRYAFAGIIVGFLLAVLGFGLIIDASGLPEKAQEFGAFNKFFQHKYSGDTWAAGVVIDLEDDIIELHKPDGEILFIQVTDRTRINPPFDIIKNEILRVVGKWQNDVFTAEYIQHGSLPRGGPFKPTPGIKGNCYGSGCNR